MNEQLSELHISKALVIETGSDEEESSSESEGETFEDVLRNAGVEFELSSLKPAPDGKAPFELVSQVGVTASVLLVSTSTNLHVHTHTHTHTHAHTHSYAHSS